MSRPDGYLADRHVGFDPDEVLAEIARGFRMSVDDIIGPSRDRAVCVARACAMAVIRHGTNLSLPAIGRIFDRDDSTVFHNVRKVMNDPELGESVRQLIEELSPPPRLFAVPGPGVCTDNSQGSSTSYQQAKRSTL